MLPQNLHTHTVYGDGKNTPEVMVLGAISSGCRSLGFSEHSPMGSPEGDGWAMRGENLPAYRRDVLSLRDKYAHRLPIFLGLELDVDSPLPDGQWDYLLCSCHGIWVDGVYRSVDYSAECTRQTIRECFGGDSYAYTAAYFRRLGHWAESFPGQIVGHADLVTKFNEGGAMFDESDPRYLSPAMEALEALSAKELIFEINTGAMSRGYRTTPYPSPALLRFLREKGARVCLTSDSHSADTIVHAFSQAAELAKSCGFREVQVLTEHGFIGQAI